MNPAAIYRTRPSEAVLLAGAFTLLRDSRPFSCSEVARALDSVNAARFRGMLEIEEIPRLDCVEVRTGRDFIREFWVSQRAVSYFPHDDDSAFETWMLHQVGHRVAQALGAAIDFDHALMTPFFHQLYATPQEFVDRSPECAGLRHLGTRLRAAYSLRAALDSLPAGIRSIVSHPAES